MTSFIEPLDPCDLVSMTNSHQASEFMGAVRTLDVIVKGMVGLGGRTDSDTQGYTGTALSVQYDETLAQVLSTLTSKQS